MDLAPLRVDGPITCLIVPSLPAASIAWNTSSTDQGILGVEDVLLHREPVRATLEKLRRLLLVHVEAERLSSVEVLQPEILALCDAERVCVFSNRVDDVLARHVRPPGPYR